MCSLLFCLSPAGFDNTSALMGGQGGFGNIEGFSGGFLCLYEMNMID